MVRGIFCFVIAALLLPLLAACDLAAAREGVVEGVQVTPTATVDPSGYQATAPQACLLNSLGTIQAERRAAGQIQWQQGSLVAFQPGGDRLAYLAPFDRTSWFAGALTIVSAPDFKERVSLAPSVQAVGDLTWSPDGQWLAFLAFRLSENVQTVMVIRPDAEGSRPIDLFPTDLARTDNRTSQKAIIGWKDSRTLQVIVSCGEQCRLAYDIDVESGLEPAQEPTVVADYHELADNLTIPRRVLAYEAEEYPKNMSTSMPHWSPDGNMVAYLDRKTFPWLLSIEEKINYPLDIGLRDVIETQWSSDSAYLVVRAEDRVFIFETPCRNKGN